MEDFSTKRACWNTHKPAQPNAYAQYFCLHSEDREFSGGRFNGLLVHAAEKNTKHKHARLKAKKANIHHLEG